jgi:hypothetical protein
VAIDYLRRKSWLSMDVPTRWNSTYLMLEAAEKFERAFDRMVIDGDQYMEYFEEPSEMGKTPNVLPVLLIGKMLGCFASFLDFFMKQLYVSLDH